MMEKKTHSERERERDQGGATRSRLLQEVGHNETRINSATIFKKRGKIKK